MKFKFIIILLSGIPTTVIFLIGIYSQVLAFYKIVDFVQDNTDNMLQDQIMFLKQMSIITSIKLSYAVQHVPYSLNLINNLYYKIINNQVKINSNYQPSILSFYELYVETGDPILLTMYKQNPILINNWMIQDFTNISQLNDTQKAQLNLASWINPLFRSIMYANQIARNNELFHLNYSIAFAGFRQTGLLYSSVMNSTFQNLPSDHCSYNNNTNVYDPRCQFWYNDSLNEISTNFSPPLMMYNLQTTPFLGQLGCQRMMYYDSTLAQDAVHHVFCFQMKTNDFQAFLVDYAINKIQLYIIDPVNQFIVYDSLGLNVGQQLSSVYGKYDFDNEDQANMLNIVQQYSKIENYIFDSSNTEDQYDYYANPTVFEKDINGTLYNFVTNPVYVLDKLPIYINQTSKINKKFRYILVYLQSGMVADDQLKEIANKVFNFSQQLLKGISIFLLCLIFIFIFITYYYSILINQLLHAPIEKMTLILKRLRNQKISKDYQFIIQQFQYEQEEVFLAKEVYDLSQSITQVFQVLLQISENYYKTNPDETLIRLNSNIHFFNSSQNYYALGITHNNIGAILLHNEHYYQAMEHFQSAIICARYEIQEFCQSHPESKSIEYLSQYCYQDDFQRIILPQKKDRHDSLESEQEDFHSRTSSIPNRSDRPTKISKSRFSRGFSMFRQLFHKKKQNSLSQNNPESDQKQQEIKKYFKYQSTLQVDIFGNNLFRELDEDELLLKQQEDEFYQLRIQLILNVYYRKMNYVLALIYVQSSFENKQNKLNKAVHHNEIIPINFWKEIKAILRELILIAQKFGFSISYTLILYSHLKNCYNKLDKKHKVDELNEKIKVLLPQYVQKTYASNSNINLLTPHNIEEINLKSKIYEDTGEKEQTKNEPLLSNLSKRSNPNGSNVSNGKLKNQMTSPMIRTSMCSSPKNQLKNRLSFFDVLDPSSQQQPQQLTVPTSTFYQKKRYFEAKSLSKSDKDNLFTLKDEIDNNPQNTQKDKPSTEEGATQLKTNKKAQSENEQNKFTSFNFQNRKKTMTMKSYSSKQANISNNKLDSESRANKIQKYYIKQKYEGFALKHCNEFTQYQKRQILVENVETMVGIFNVDILISQKRFIEAADILTSIIENSQALLSHFSFLVYRRLKDIFIHYGIYSKELDYMYKKFNHKIHIQVYMIFHTTEENENWLYSFFLTKQLLTKALIQKEDKYGIIEIIQSDFDLHLMVKLQTLKQINEVVHPIFEEMLGEYLTKYDKLYQQLFQKDYEQTIAPYEMTSQKLRDTPEKNLNIEQRYQLFQTNDQLLLPLSKETPPQQSPPQNQLYLSDFENNNFNNNNNNLNSKSNQSFHLKSNIYYEGQDLLGSEQNTTSNDLKVVSSPLMKKKWNQHQRISLESQPLNTQNNNYMFSQFQIHEGDDEPESSFSLDKECVKLKQTDTSFIKPTSDERTKSEYLNFFFHMSVRKALSDLITTQFTTYKEAFSNTHQNHLKPTCQHFEFNPNNIEYNKDYFLKDFHMDLNYKFIIFSTQRICIIQDSFFQELCKILSKFQIQILIFSIEKGDNFLEKQPDLIYMYNDSHLIRVFYEIHKLIGYINSKRDSFQKETSISFIQHY